MPCTYVTVIDLEVTNARGYPDGVVKVRIAKNRITVTGPQISGNSAGYAETMAMAVLAATARARRIHHRVFGLRAP